MRNAILDMNPTKISILFSQITSALPGTSMYFFFNVLTRDFIFSLTLDHQFHNNRCPALFVEKCKMTAVKSDIKPAKPVFPAEEEELTDNGWRNSVWAWRLQAAQVVLPAQDCKMD